MDVLLNYIHLFYQNQQIFNDMKAPEGKHQVVKPGCYSDYLHPERSMVHGDAQ